MEEASASHKLAEHAFHSARALLSPAPPTPHPPRTPSAPPPGVREAAQLALQWLRRHSVHSAAAESCAQWEDSARPPSAPRTALNDDWRLPTSFIRALSLTIAPHADGEARPRLAPPAASPPAEARALRRTASFGARGAPSTPPPRAPRTPRTAERGGTNTPPRGGARRSAARGEEEGGRGVGEEGGRGVGEEGGRGVGEEGGRGVEGEGGRGVEGGGASLREVLQLIELGLDGQIEEMTRELSDIASRAAVRLSPPKPSPRCWSPHSSGHAQRGFASEWSTPFASEHASPSASDGEEEIEESTPPASPRIASLRPASRVSTGSDSGFATPKRREARVSRGYMCVFLLQARSKVEKLQRELEAALDGEKTAIAEKRELQAKLQQAKHASRQSSSRVQACASKLAGVEATNASLHQRLAALTAAADGSHSDAEGRKGETAPAPAVGGGGGQKDGVSRGPLAVEAESRQRCDSSAASASPSPADSDAEEGWLGERRSTGLHDSIRAGLLQLQSLIETSKMGSGLRPAEGGDESSTPLPAEDKERIAQMQRDVAILELRNASMAVSLQRCRELYTRRARHLRASRWLVRLFCAWASYATARKMSTDLVASRDESATLWSNLAEAHKSLASARQVIAKKDVQLSQLTHVLADATAQLDHVSSGM
ncbi:hypothetical protein AB1Y20_002183 [Prymnesium parvum]|uniref:Uncharacterized protein n=1 Tax=Prymnesium parvum TaxID=97485 RepID=A0AB34J879_PRYPA